MQRVAAARHETLYWRAKHVAESAGDILVHVASTAME
jgi:hypothetical protein